MPELISQKSTHSAETANCPYLAASTNTIHLRENDEPEVALSPTPPALHELIRTLKSAQASD
ncbi:hypothetical protein BX281_3721 [Streptomyces sp. Ag82_O1-15]|uniref:DUF397 domain-containing protein n=1 Tax=Streptomyces sp. Ag82_O1-15 TaxID=1938855 RepID=UPI000BB0DBB6|nr:DUF397 domain-containing protein [Streptomyces sp. Ag82_O1-15]PBC95740.1 hypothetical protein BX281_3721 [Streptomyces sp. Ag82_O1-15]